MKKQFVMGAAVAVVAALAACSKSEIPREGDGDGGDFRNMKLFMSLGAVFGASCNVIGDSGAVLVAGVLSNADGSVDVGSVETDEFPIVVICSGGAYWDEALGQNVPLDPDDTVSSLVPDVATLDGLGGNVAVTPLTDLAASLYQSLPVGDRDATSAAAALDSILDAIAPDLAADGNDLLTPPEVVNEDDQDIDGSDFAAEYAAYLAGLAGSANEQGQNAIQALRDLRQDLLGENNDLENSSTLLSRIVARARTFVQNNAALSQRLSNDSSGDGVVDDPGGDTGLGGGT